MITSFEKSILYIIRDLAFYPFRLPLGLLGHWNAPEKAQSPVKSSSDLGNGLTMLNYFPGERLVQKESQGEQQIVPQTETEKKKKSRKLSRNSNQHV